MPFCLDPRCNPWLVHRDVNIYGPDAEEFRPERWLDEAAAKTYSKYNMGFGYGESFTTCLALLPWVCPLPYLTGSGADPRSLSVSGARVCLGRDVAMMELYKAPLQFFRNFTPETQNKEEPGKYVIKGGVSYFEDMFVNISRRAAAA